MWIVQVRDERLSHDFPYSEKIKVGFLFFCHFIFFSFLDPSKQRAIQRWSDYYEETQRGFTSWIGRHSTSADRYTVLSFALRNAFVSLYAPNGTDWTDTLVLHYYIKSKKTEFLVKLGVFRQNVTPKTCSQLEKLLILRIGILWYIFIRRIT